MNMANHSIQTKRRLKVYVTRSMPQRGLDALLTGCNVSMWDSDDSVPRGELLQSVAGTDGILCLASDTIDSEVLDAAGTNLRAVATMSSVSDHIDTVECAKRGIRVIVCPSQSTDGIVDLTIALILLTLKSANEETIVYNCVLSTDAAILMNNCRNKTFGIYGLSHLGRSVAKRLIDLGATSVIATTSGNHNETAPITSDIEQVEWTELLRRSDILCNCATVEDHPLHMFTKEAFHEMKASAVVVDCFGGKTVTYLDLYEALRDGCIAGAGINECHREPMPFKYPLKALHNCVFLPQSKESIYDIRHKESMTVAHLLVDVLVNTDKLQERLIG